MLHYTPGCICVLIALLFSGAVPAHATITRHEFSRYQVILDKKPFGEVAPLETIQPQAALGDVIARELEMKSIIDEGTSIRVGWLDKKTNKNFSMAVGETHEGLELVSVNYDEEEAVVKKGGETALVKLRPSKDKDQAAPAAAVSPAMIGALAVPGASPFQAGQAPAPARRPFFSDLKARRTSPFQPVGTNALPFQAKPLDSFFKVSTGTFPKAQSPFGPFQVPAGSAKGVNPFQALSSGATNAANPFAPVLPAVPQNPDADNQSHGQTIDQFMQVQPADNQFPAGTDVIIEEVVE